VSYEVVIRGILTKELADTFAAWVKKGDLPESMSVEVRESEEGESHWSQFYTNRHPGKYSECKICRGTLAVASPKLPPAASAGGSDE